MLNVTRGAELGSGAFGKVYKGDWDGQAVALKQITDTSPEAASELEAEVEVLVKLNHPKIVRLLGMCELDDGHRALVMEFCKRGSLDVFLKRNHGKVDSKQLVKWCHHIALGMAYLHKQQVVHRDCACRNVLLDGHKSAKLTDFGLSRSLDHEDQYLSTSAMPVRWTAPESLCNHVVTAASDCYSLGITAIECFNFGEMPFNHVTSNFEVYEAVVKNEQRPERPENMPKDVYAILERLWCPESDDRCTASEAAEMFKQAKTGGGKVDAECDNETVDLGSGYADPSSGGAQYSQTPAHVGGT
jgi:serine/threonine protein kinase